jgi:hypothetical protein
VRFASTGQTPATSSNASAPCCKSFSSGTDIPTFSAWRPVRSSRTRTSCSGFGNGSGRSSTASTTLKMAVFAPMPKASVKTTTAVNPGFFQSIRSPYRTSRRRVISSPRSSEQ